MSSVRISQHTRPGGPLGSTERPDAPPGGASFALALGSAALTQKELAARLFSAKANDATDGSTPSPKRTGRDGKAADAAAVLAAQETLSATVAGQMPLPRHDAVDARAASDSDLENAADVAKRAAGVAANSIATGDDTANGSLQSPHGMLAVTTRDATSAPTSALELDGSTQSSTPADAAVASLGISSNSDPKLTVGPNLNLAQSLPSVLPGLASALLPTAAGQSGDGNGDPASGSDGTATSAALGATGETPALANAPTATASSAIATDGSTTATVSDQVAGHMVRLLASGSREMVMRLHPPELGEVTVRVAVNGRDVSAWFGSPQPQVQTAIADGIGQLQTDLGNAGYNLNGAWVGSDASGARQQGAGLASRPTTPITRAAEASLSNAAVSQPLPSAVNIYV